jgi:hypothetical protein
LRESAGNFANHLRHPPTQRLRRTRGYGGQDVKVLPVPTPILNERKAAMKKIMKALRFPSAIKLKGLLAHIKNVNRCLLPILSGWVFILDFVHGYVDCSVSGALGDYQIGLSLFVFFMALFFGPYKYVFVAFVAAMSAAMFVH